jgi:hypothetical protein
MSKNGRLSSRSSATGWSRCRLPNGFFRPIVSWFLERQRNSRNFLGESLLRCTKRRREHRVFPFLGCPTDRLARRYCQDLLTDTFLFLFAAVPNSPAIIIAPLPDLELRGAGVRAPPGARAEDGAVRKAGVTGAELLSVKRHLSSQTHIASGQRQDKTQSPTHGPRPPCSLFRIILALISTPSNHDSVVVL